jgi:8-oxo-dGTP pyrophosphatase MutT (NUDIX family)
VTSRRDPSIVEVVAEALARDPAWIAPPISAPRGTAAVGVVLHEAPTGAELLFIERAKREGDFWSGDMAFPGGRADETDADLEATARREVREELGFDLPDPLGRIDDFDSRAHHRNYHLVVAGFVYAVESKPAIEPSSEVAAALWIPLRDLVAPHAWIHHERRFGAGIQRVPAIAYDGRVIWGMTYRMLSTLVRRIGYELPSGA